MSVMRRRSVALGAALLTLVCFTAILLGKPNPVLPQKSDSTPQLEPGQTAEAELKTASIQGTTTRKPVVYFHFAPDGCENCAGLAPTLQRFSAEHGSEYDVVGIVITHWGRHDATAVRIFVRTHGITFPIVGFKSLAYTEPKNPS